MLFMMKKVMMAGLTPLWVESLFLSHEGLRLPHSNCHVTPSTIAFVVVVINLCNVIEMMSYNMQGRLKIVPLPLLWKHQFISRISCSRNDRIHYGGCSLAVQCVYSYCNPQAGPISILELMICSFHVPVIPVWWQLLFCIWSSFGWWIQIQAAFRTDEIRRAPPTPQDEMRAGMSYFHETIWNGLPTFLRRVDTALKTIGLEERLPYNVPLIQFSSWMGGDRDGESLHSTSQWAASWISRQLV
jgi:hypothetical protein